MGREPERGALLHVLDQPPAVVLVEGERFVPGEAARQELTTVAAELITALS